MAKLEGARWAQHDVVVLRSGGPAMTVVGMRAERGSFAYRCDWTDDSGGTDSGWFAEVTLEDWKGGDGGRPQAT